LKQIPKYIFLSGIFLVLILFTGWLLISLFKLNLLFSDIAILTTVFILIALVTLIIFFKGQKKNAESQTFYLLVAISLKFLLEMIFALLWFLVVKKCYSESVLMFFVLYLTLTSFSISVILKTLKNKAL
jgi:hypothetical protein